MKNHRTPYLLGIIILLYFAVQPAAIYGSQTSHDILIDILARHGFENIKISESPDQLIISYENRIYRFEMRAVKKVFELISPYTEKKSVILIVEYRGLPMVCVRKDPDQYEVADTVYQKSYPGPGVEASLDIMPYSRMLTESDNYSSSYYKFDFIIHPQFVARFGNFDDPVESQINLAPEIRTSFWKGMSLSMQCIIPLQNDLGKEGDEIRPGILAFNQMFRLPQCTFLSYSCGYFSQNRYGFDLEASKYSANGRWEVHVNLGYTGYASYLKRVLTYTNLYRITYFLSCAYRIPKLDVTVRMTFGQYLDKDRGFDLSVMRQFKEVFIGFYALKTSTGTNGGFYFSVPLMPSKRAFTRRIRFIPPNDFSWNYRYLGLINSGIRYETGNRISWFMDRVMPDYIETRYEEL